MVRKPDRLADQLEINRANVSKWCRNEMQPRVETLFQIARVLDVGVKMLLVSTKSKQYNNLVNHQKDWLHFIVLVQILGYKALLLLFFVEL